MSRIYNFSAGPAILPQEVLARAADEMLDWLLTEIGGIEHVEVVRIGTRTPVVLPYRITDELVEMLKKHHPLWINTHVNHPAEITASSRQALA